MTSTEEPTYPPAGLEHHHGRPVYELGEDGDQFVVAGHGRRALAAFSSFARYAFGTAALGHVNGSTGVTAREGHAVFHRSCGCTPEDHAAGHPRPAEDGDGPDDTVPVDCSEVCDELHGLPPCGSDWSFVALQAAEDNPAALPVTWIGVPR